MIADKTVSPDLMWVATPVQGRLAGRTTTAPRPSLETVFREAVREVRASPRVEAARQAFSPAPRRLDLDSGPRHRRERPSCGGQPTRGCRNYHPVGTGPGTGRREGPQDAAHALELPARSQGRHDDQNSGRSRRRARGAASVRVGCHSFQLGTKRKTHAGGSKAKESENLDSASSLFTSSYWKEPTPNTVSFREGCVSSGSGPAHSEEICDFI